MRLSSTLLLLPALAAAQDQIPLGDRLQGWFNKAKSLLPTATPVVSSAAESVASTASSKAAPKYIEKEVVPIKLSNWQSLLAPSSHGLAKEWLIYVTGGNKTCFGRCGNADKAWNASIPLFSTDVTSPTLGKIDCESEGILCSVLSAGPPSVWHWQVPARELDQPKPETAIRIVRLNSTTVDAETIYKVHSEKQWEKRQPLQGALHPVDGALAKYGLNVPLGYVLFGMGMVPSWLMMVGISFLSRTIMSRRVGPTARPQAAPPAGAAQ
ncbi:hypothetical protein AJ79_09490 [Helicocarpus griseus UAMH5409]|uniref:Peptidyl-tRNA hydrolase n=1 Tax=Helicocarpus griseus UAMH5409 TaxID=1447875 RepID=A0A2B7WIW5_9EURO|nr:hypothetical protein AJ79_09490 [Helicocarpus griseus UAMH5409]